jgi:hypothetical protein
MPAFVRVELDGREYFNKIIFPEPEVEDFQSQAIPLPSSAWQAVVSCANDDSHSHVVVWNNAIPYEATRDDADYLQALRERVAASKILHHEEVLPVTVADGPHLLTLTFQHMILMTPDTRMTELQLRAK